MTSYEHQRIILCTVSKQLKENKMTTIAKDTPVITTGVSLEEIFQNVNGAAFIGVDTLTEVKLTGGKSNPFQGRVTKASTGNSVQVFTNKNSNAYENMVKRRLVAEGKDPEDFKLGVRTWGTRIINTPCVEHNGELYLEVIFLKAGTSTIMVDGLPYSKEIPGMPVGKESNGQGGLDAQVVIRTFKASSVKRVRVDHKEFIL